MFRIEELLKLFQNDQEVMEIIKSAYMISQRNNKELSDIIFQQLLFLKSIQPNLNIKINHELNCPSNYNPQTNTINLNGLFDETTFFHELTHLFSYYYEKFKTPHEYNHLKNKFLSSNENTSIIILFLNLCQKEK